MLDSVHCGGDTGRLHCGSIFHPLQDIGQLFQETAYQETAAQLFQETAAHQDFGAEQKVQKDARMDEDHKRLWYVLVAKFPM